MFRSLEEEVAYLRAQRIGDGNSSGKLSDSECGNVPYEVLIQDLTQAKRQLLELHSLVSHYNSNCSKYLSVSFSSNHGILDALFS